MRYAEALEAFDPHSALGQPPERLRANGAETDNRDLSVVPVRHRWSGTDKPGDGGGGLV